MNSFQSINISVIDVTNEDIGCIVGTEETLNADGSVKSIAHPTVLEAQYLSLIHI